MLLIISIIIGIDRICIVNHCLNNELKSILFGRLEANNYVDDLRLTLSPNCNNYSS